MDGGRRIFANLPLRSRLRSREPHLRSHGLQGERELSKRPRKSDADGLQHGFLQSPETEEYFCTLLWRGFDDQLVFPGGEVLLGQHLEIDASVYRLDIHPNGMVAANGANDHPAGMRKVETDVMLEIEVEFRLSVSVGTKMNRASFEYHA